MTLYGSGNVEFEGCEVVGMLGPVIELFSRVSRGTAYIGYKRSETDGEQAISDFTKFRYPVSYGGTAPNFCRFHEQGVLPYPLLAAPACGKQRAAIAKRSWLLRLWSCPINNYCIDLTHKGIFG